MIRYDSIIFLVFICNHVVLAWFRSYKYRQFKAIETIVVYNLVCIGIPINFIFLQKISRITSNAIYSNTTLFEEAKPYITLHIWLIKIISILNTMWKRFLNKINNRLFPTALSSFFFQSFCIWNYCKKKEEKKK